MSWYFNDKVDKLLLDGGFSIETTSSRRLVKLICKKTKEFKAWTIHEKIKIDKSQISESQSSFYDTIVTIKKELAERDDQLNHLSESGIYDYTIDGSFFGLTAEERDRALIKETNLYK